MARQGNRSSCANSCLLGKTCDQWFLARCLLDLHIMTQSKWSIGAMKYTPTCNSFLFVVGISSTLFILWRRPTSRISSSASLSFWPWRLVLPAMYHYQSGLLDSSLLIGVTQQSIKRSHCSGPAPCLLMFLVGWAISQTCSVTLLSICCVVKPPSSCQIPMVHAAHWLTPTAAYSAQMWTWRVGILSPDVDLKGRNLDCISICDDWFQQPERRTLHFRFSMVVNDWVVDIQCFWLWTSCGEYWIDYQG